MSQENSLLVPRLAVAMATLSDGFILERTDTANDDRTPLSLTELWVFDIPDSEEGDCYTLTKALRDSGTWQTSFGYLPEWLEL
ncbi:hypothetical protein BKA70DRAFT_1330542, partial [Coprinopsis sp. MPI-PUGE-AT-0042]